MVEIDWRHRWKMYTKRGKTSITQHYWNKNEKNKKKNNSKCKSIYFAIQFDSWFFPLGMNIHNER